MNTLKINPVHLRRYVMACAIVLVLSVTGAAEASPLYQAAEFYCDPFKTGLNAVRIFISLGCAAVFIFQAAKGIGTQLNLPFGGDVRWGAVFFAVVIAIFLGAFPVEIANLFLENISSSSTTPMSVPCY